jgi:glutathione S-transferase
MAKPVLHIGDKNYSSWSLRPWLALKHGGIAFDEVQHDLPELGGGAPAFGAISPTGRVPALDLGEGVVIVESIAICEWAADMAASLWPADPVQRAQARSLAAIMHAGFVGLRNEAPMNIRRCSDASRMTAAGLGDAAKMDALWSAALQKSGGPWLFGKWSIADAMYAPAVTRFVTYAIPRSADGEAYIAATCAEPHMAAWIEAAGKETRRLARTDVA